MYSNTFFKADAKDDDATKYFPTLNIFIHSAVVKSKMKFTSIW
jgi:hypothetical protein